MGMYIKENYDEAGKQFETGFHGEKVKPSRNQIQKGEGKIQEYASNGFDEKAQMQETIWKSIKPFAEYQNRKGPDHERVANLQALYIRKKKGLKVLKQLSPDLQEHRPKSRNLDIIVDSPQKVNW